MKNTRTAGGFTLVELLVVIAILGILTSFVLPRFRDAQDKAVDAKVTANLAALNQEASIYFSDNGFYTNLCSQPAILSKLSSAQSDVGDPAILGGLGDGECISNATAWAAWVNFRYASTTARCVDSNGRNTVIPAQDSSLVDLTVCP